LRLVPEPPVELGEDLVPGPTLGADEEDVVEPELVIDVALAQPVGDLLVDEQVALFAC